MPGGLDDNGIYQYAEDDDVAPGDGFSDLLNLLGLSVSEVVADLSTRLQAVEVPPTLVWTDATFKDGYTHFDTTSNKVQWAVRNKTVYWRGLVKPSAGGSHATTQADMIVVPSTILPINNWRFDTFCAGDRSAKVNVNPTTSAISREATTTSTGAYISLEGVTYPLG